jgi:hypothetical protein
MTDTVYTLDKESITLLKEMAQWYRQNRGHFPDPGRRNPRLFGEGVAGSELRRAKLTANAGAGMTITANLYNNAGIEQTTGAEHNVTVYCDISDGSSALNICIPRLVNGKEIKVAKLAYDNSGTIQYRWYLIGQVFQPIDTTMFDIVSNKLSDKLDSCT